MRTGTLYSESGQISWGKILPSPHVNVVTFSVHGRTISLYNETVEYGALTTEQEKRLVDLQKGLRTMIANPTQDFTELDAALKAYEDAQVNEDNIYDPKFADKRSSRVTQFYARDIHPNGQPHHHIYLQGYTPSSVQDLGQYIQRLHAQSAAVSEYCSRLPRKEDILRRIASTSSDSAASPQSELADLLIGKVDGKKLLENFREDVSAARIEDYIGEEAVMQRMQHIIGAIKDPESYRRAMRPVERKLLLSGPPGTGKTLFAMTVAHELGAKFFKPTFAKTGNVFQDAAGLNLSAILDALMEEAKKGPTVVLFDELDGMGTNATGDFLANSESGRRDALLTQIEKMNHPNLVIIGTTNKPTAIDPALQRPGRFGNPIEILPFTTPEVKARALHVFLQQQANEYSEKLENFVAPDVEQHFIDTIVPKLPAEVTGAELQALVKLAIAKRGDRYLQNGGRTQEYVTVQDMLDAIEEAFKGKSHTAMGFVS